MKQHSYKQPQKEKVRNDMFAHVVSALTKKRSSSCCVRDTYVREVYEALIKKTYTDDCKNALQLPNEYINLWESFHKSIVRSYTPEDLTVCYLSGPEPLNDFEALVKLGIHPHNIWAFENDDQCYKDALIKIKESKFPLLKIHKGSVEQFFIDTPKKFDIVYIDACGPLPSRSQRTLRLISTLLRHHRINSPGALVTNFASPDLSDINQKESYSYLVSHYLFSKKYLECYDSDGNSSYIDGPCTQGFSEQEGYGFQTFFDKVKNNFDHYYSQYITRQIFDLASMITPWIRLTNSTYWPHFFNETSYNVSQRAKEYQKKVYKHESINIHDEPCNYPLQWAIYHMDNNEGHEYNIDCDILMKFYNNWLDELCGFPAIKVKAREAIECYDVLRFNMQYYTKRFADSIANFDYRNKMFQFCDVPSKTLGFDLIINQLSYPMHYSTDAVKRWTYKAKETRMYLDAIILDECRYIYEWLPTIDLINNAFSNIGQQLSYRFALDGLVKNRMFYNTEYFFGASILSQYESGFESKLLSPRIII